MHNKKIIAKGLALGLVLSNTPIDSMADVIDEYNISREENKNTNLKKEEKEDKVIEIKESIDDFFENLLNRNDNKNTKQAKEIIKTNPNVRTGTILEITLSDGQFVEDLSGNPDGYETIRVTTIGDKKLVKQDYDNLRLSGIPKVDLSNSYSDSIPRGAFTNATHLLEFKFPQEITSIGGNGNDGAFYGCSGLTGDLIIPNSVISIGHSAFKGCSGFTGDLVIPNSVTSINTSAFSGCSGLTGDLVIPSSVTTIGYFVFQNCSGFTGDLIIPNSVTTIGYNAFENCSGFTGDLIIPNSVVTIGMYAFSRCSGFDGDLIIGDSVRTIEHSAFRDCSGLTGDLIIPNSVTTIGHQAFKNCSGFKGSLVIPESVTSIGDGVFNGCSGFTGNLTIPNSVTTIGNNTFDGCSGFTGNLTIPNSVTTIGNNAFDGCNGFTGSLTIPNSVTSIGSWAFQNCSGFTGSLTIPNSVTTIGNNAFYGCSNIKKIIILVDETYESLNYRKDIVEKLPTSNTYIEMPYNFNISNTWLNSTNYRKIQPTISTYVGVFENNEGIGISLEVAEASPIRTMTILKDGMTYNIEKNENGKYVFNEPGDYQVYIETELGTISNMRFKNISPINTPNINILDNNLTLINNGILSNSHVEKENTLEDFNDSNNLKYNFSNSNWTVENGILKSETITHSKNTENEFIVNAKAGEKLQINVKTSSEDSHDWGYIYLNGTQVYKKTGESIGFEIIELDLQEGENTIKFKYTKDGSYSKGDDCMSIDYIKILKNEIVTIDCDTLEYRINGGDWQTYTDAFELNYPTGTRVQIEVRACHDGFVSSIYSKEVTVELNTKDIEEAIEKAEQSKDAIDISNARDLVNQMFESSKKDEFQNRLDSIFPNITLTKENATVNLDLYIKSENMLRLTLDTNSITFDNFSGVQDVENLNAVNLTVNSSLPYKINAYMPTDIKNVDGTNIMSKDILNIRANGQSSYNTFVDKATPIVLLDNQSANNDVNHGIDLMLKGNLAHEKDVYKTTIKFEVEQK